MTTREEFIAHGLELSREANVLEDMHSYFVAHAERMLECCARFGLLQQPLGDVLEVGPFYGYTPFLLRPNSRSYAVLEGDDPAAYPLKPLYQKRQIDAQFVDLFEMFGPTHQATHQLPFQDAAFDTLLCWETMEHFNFNPIKFVREVRRVLKPGGRAYITVPNKASALSLFDLALGRRDHEHIEGFYRFEDYVCNQKKAFYGFHWREYTSPELEHLFTRADFRIRQSGTFVSFQTHAHTSLARGVARAAYAGLASVLRRYGTNVYLVAEK